MARKIKQAKLFKEDIHKNSGKEISHTITKIKKHEKLYTFILVIIFMCTISISAFLGLSVDKYKLYDASYYASNFTMRGQLVALSSANVMNDENGLKSQKYTVKYSNNTSKNINYLLRFAMDEETLERCDCMDKVVPYHKLRFSLDGKSVQQFTDETMVLTAGMISSRKSDSVKVRLWIDDSVEDSDCLYYGKFIIEELEDMDS